MTISSVDGEIKELIEKHHVYGAEVIVNALVRASADQKYIDQSDIIHLVIRAFRRQDEERMSRSNEKHNNGSEQLSV